MHMVIHQRYVGRGELLHLVRLDTVARIQRARFGGAEASSGGMLTAKRRKAMR